MNYKGLDGAFDAKTPHLGGNITVGDPFTYCPSIWDYVISRFAIDSVLDLGSGYGNASLYFFQKGLKVIAVDGFDQNILTSVYPTVKHDLADGPIMTKVDLVHCHEVVEHIEEKYLSNLLISLLSGKIILLTHAVPGQGGHHHVNEQPSEYWIDHLKSKGCSLLDEDTSRIRELAEIDGAKYMAKTGMVFANIARTQTC